MADQRTHTVRTTRIINNSTAPTLLLGRLFAFFDDLFAIICGDNFELVYYHLNKQALIVFMDTYFY